MRLDEEIEAETAYLQTLEYSLGNAARPDSLVTYEDAEAHVVEQREKVAALTARKGGA